MLAKAEVYAALEPLRERLSIKEIYFHEGDPVDWQPLGVHGGTMQIAHGSLLITWTVGDDGDLGGFLRGPHHWNIGDMTADELVAAVHNVIEGSTQWH